MLPYKPFIESTECPILRYVIDARAHAHGTSPLVLARCRRLDEFKESVTVYWDEQMVYEETMTGLQDLLAVRLPNAR